MKAFYIFLLSFLLCGFLAAQERIDFTPLDTSIRINGDTLIMKIRFKDFNEVIMFYPYHSSIDKGTIPSIKEIRYTNGMIASLVKKPKPVKVAEKIKKDDIKDTAFTWQKVKVVFNDGELPTNAVDKGEVVIDYTGEFTASSEDLEKKCIAAVKKKAFKSNANYVLITFKNIRREYGELPVVEMEGNAYWVDEKK